MGIMLAISGIVVGSYIGMTRGTAAYSAETHLYNALMLARQRATLEGARTYLWVDDEDVDDESDGVNSYRIFREAGEVTAVENGTHPDYGAVYYLYDEYADLSQFSAFVYEEEEDDEGRRGELFNIDEMFSADLIGSPEQVDHPDPPPPGEYSVKKWRFSVDRSPGQWEKGDRYGWELYPRRYLPNGFVFDPGDVDDGIYFDPDGTSNGGNFILYQKIYENTPSQHIEIRVANNGRISVEQGVRN